MKYGNFLLCVGTVLVISATTGCSTSNDAENKVLRQQVADLEQAQKAAAQQAAAQQAAAQQAAAQQAAANAGNAREDFLKKLAHVAANAVNENHHKMARISNPTASVKDFYNELYAEINTRLSAETTGLTGDDLEKKAKDIAQKWAQKKMIGF